jgi:Ca-activated chloride channel family protein
VGEVPFFGLKETGTRFVYLLDSSGSMMNHNAIRVAKAELMASLQSLDATQQFQIIFYNTSAQSMTQRSDPEKLYWATDINRTIARQFISGIQPDGGTSHVPAIKKALKFNPEVLFFLTDADEPQLSAAEMDEIHKLNRGGTRIHCVEFGKGPDLSVDNFLKKLARQNNGLYQYRDVTKFDR